MKKLLITGGVVLVGLLLLKGKGGQGSGGSADPSGGGAPPTNTSGIKIDLDKKLSENSTGNEVNILQQALNSLRELVNKYGDRTALGLANVPIIPVTGTFGSTLKNVLKFWTGQETITIRTLIPKLQASSNPLLGTPADLKQVLSLWNTTLLSYG